MRTAARARTSIIARVPKPPYSADAAQRLRDHLAAVTAMRAGARGDPALQAYRLALRAFQARRLERTYPDLLASPRYGPAAAFFLSDLYGTKDVTARDEGVARSLPMLVRLMPAAALDTIARAVELDALSERLDLGLVDALRRSDPSGATAITDTAYSNAYRAAGTKADRERQIALTGDIGAALDRLAHKPLLGGALRMMEVPARQAGFGALHDFLARGLKAFRHMRGADEFLRIVDARERLINDRLFGGLDDPFALRPSDIGQMA
jgi:hypothetical protein